VGRELSHTVRIFGISVHILNMDCPTLKCGARSNRVPAGSNRVTLNEIPVRFRYIVGGGHMEKFTVESIDECLFRLT
jgi:hypothetical protein